VNAPFGPPQNELLAYFDRLEKHVLFQPGNFEAELAIISRLSELVDECGSLTQARQRRRGNRCHWPYTAPTALPCPRVQKVPIHSFQITVDYYRKQALNHVVAELG